ncbi:MAG: ABC transporter ATP-binding protein [Ruminococcaceae bacterium]|nr:ABC transporter ATP-binding protein [Oscillospiraceae bacterium]
MKNKTSLKWIIGNSRPVIPFLLISTIVSALASLCMVMLTYVGKQVVDIATGSFSGAFWGKIGLLVLFVLLELTLQVIFSRLSITISGKMEIGIKNGIFSKILKKDISSIYKYHSGDLLNRMTADVHIITGAFTNIVPAVVALLTRLIGAFLMLFWLDATFALIYLICGPIFLITTRIYSAKMKSLHKKCQESDGNIKSFIQEAIANILVIKAFKTEKPVSEEAEKLQLINYNYKLKRNTISIIANIFVFIAFTFGYYLALCWGAYKLSKGMITVGTLTAMMQLVSQVQTPFKNLSGIIPQYYQAIASAERILEIENLKEDVEGMDKESLSGIYSEAEKIIFENVSFSYDENNTVVNNFSYEINIGDFISVSGRSGIGKSTILKLLLGVIKPENGQIYLLLKDGNKIPVDEKTRGLFSYVPQGNMILSGTIGDNIRFFNNELSDEDVIKACKLARIDEFINQLPDGLDTVIGEHGIGLSEGQVQRVAIARALISEAPVILLDEATSALDEKTEKEFLEGLKTIQRKTCIIVSHKQATLDACDKKIMF